MRPRPVPSPAPFANTRVTARLEPAQLRRRIDPDSLPGPRARARHRTHIIGQDRAIEALELGLRLESPGYNVFLAGPSGSGRTTTAKHILREFREPRRPLRDFVFAHNFEEPDRPRLLVLEAGEGVKLRRAMERLVAGLRLRLPAALAIEAYQTQRDRLAAECRARESDLVAAFERRVGQAGFTLVAPREGVAPGADAIELLDGKPQVLTPGSGEGRQPERQRRRLERARQQLRVEAEQVRRRVRELRSDLANVLEDYNRQIGSMVIDGLLEEVREEFRAPKVLEYLGDVAEALRDRIPALVRQEPEGDHGEAAPCEVPPELLTPFAVNLVLTNARRKGCPIVIERNPTLVRLFGTIERAPDDVEPFEAGFMSIRAGAVLRADGGFLVLNAEDVLAEPGAWINLKRTLATGLLDVRTPEGMMGTAPSALKPEPIPVNVKVVMIGDDDVYRMLYLEEDDFKKTFKVKAEFDVEMPFDRTNLEKLMAFVNRVVTDEKLLSPNRPALALLVEESLRDAEHQQRLSTRFGVIADLLRESTYWARAAGRRRVGPSDLRRALAERARRINLVDAKYRVDIERGLILVSTTGHQVGQVNGLTVFDLGDYSFGKPCRITATVGVGREGIINIEREAGLSGETHDKGVYILTGYLRDRFGANLPLSIAASICLEQSYGPIDGDSASSTEVYAVLSALADLPLAQGIAVTGSVSQRGEIQPIGGVNQKIEGFYEICEARGLDGTQGVLIPRRNLDNLMLRPDVVDAVRQGRFHVWAISTVEEGMEVLTGLPAGVRDRDGEYPPGSINARVLARLRVMAEAMKGYR